MGNDLRCNKERMMTVNEESGAAVPCDVRMMQNFAPAAVKSVSCYLNRELLI